jgi:phosphonate transport system ATP-binding protein
MQSLSKINQEDGVTVLVSLHQVDFALNYCSRVVALKDGQVYYDGPAAQCSQTRLKEIYGTAFDEIAAIVPDRNQPTEETVQSDFERILPMAVNE